MATSGAADGVRERQFYEKTVPSDKDCDYPKNSFIPSNRHEKPIAETPLDINSLNKFESPRSSSRRDSHQGKTSLGKSIFILSYFVNSFFLRRKNCIQQFGYRRMVSNNKRDQYLWTGCSRRGNEA